MRYYGLFLLAAFLSVSIFYSDAFAAADPSEPAKIAHQKASALLSMHKRAKRVLKRTGNHPGIIEYFTLREKPQKHEAKEKIDELLLFIQKYFAVEEMCLIDRSGVEISRIVDNHIRHDLSSDEAGNIFFKAGFELAKGETMVSPIYISPDTHSWVLAYVTPIFINDEAVALLHYEHRLSSFQELLNKHIDRKKQIILATNGDGWILSDSRVEIDSQQKGDSESPSDYFAKFIFPGIDADEAVKLIDAGKPVNGYVGAYRGASRWTIFVFEKEENR